jgi:hypothetical protein
MSPNNTNPPARGAAIKFTGGKYKDKFGWMNSSWATTNKMQSVIVNMAEEGYEYAARIKKENFMLMSDVNTESTNYVEAILKQHADIDEMLNKLTKEMPKCSIPMDHHGDDIFEEALNDWFMNAQTDQRMLGHKATWCKVEFEGDRFYSAGRRILHYLVVCSLHAVIGTMIKNNKQYL